LARGSLAAFGAIVLLGLEPAPALAQAIEGSFERTLEVRGPVDLDVETSSGSINVRRGGDGRVQVTGRIRARSSRRWSEQDATARVRSIEANPPVELQGSFVRIGHIWDESTRDGVSISYDITVPRDARVRLRSGSGSQTIDGIEGRVEARTGSGSVRFSNLEGGATATAGSGSIEIDNVRGDVDVRTGSGSVRMLGLRGGAIARTGSGAIEVRGEPTREWRLHASSGSVTVGIPENARFDLSARTSSGHIDSRHPVTVLGTFGRRQLQGKVRGGGVLVDISTSSGSIRIE
jgi:DUF4097 and DUF4098 domain-containing protein YvlB